MLDHWKLIVGVITAVLMLANFCLAIWTLIHTSSRKRIEDIQTAIGNGDRLLKREIDTHAQQTVRRMNFWVRHSVETEKRVSMLEQKINSLPTHEDLRKLQEGVANVRNEVAANTAKTNATYDLVQSIQDFLLSNRK